jgi:Fe-S-cluster containining protein
VRAEHTEKKETLPLPFKATPGGDLRITIDNVIVQPCSLSFQQSEPTGGHPHSLDYSHHPEILARARQLISTIVDIDNEELLDALRPEDSSCFMCGECCRCYRLEVTPVDIARMASHYAMTREAFRDKYLYPSLFSWNEGNGLMGKQNRAPSDISYNYSDCIFLRKKGEGLSYCSIYEARPDSCRDYTPTNWICRKMHQRNRAGELTDNIASLEITGTELTLLTEETSGREPLSICLDMKEEKLIGEAYSKLKEELLRSFTEAQA